MKEITFDEFYKRNLMIFISLLIGMSLFTAYSIFLHEKIEGESAANELFQSIVPIVAISCTIASMFIMKSRLAHIKMQTNKQTAMRLYSSASVIQWGLVEVPVLFTVVVYMITANDYFLYITFALLLYYISLYPNKRKMQELIEQTEL